MIELGLQPHLGDRYQDNDPEKYPFDFVIGSASSHSWNGSLLRRLFLKAEATRRHTAEAFQATLENIGSWYRILMSLGHIDYVVRYGKNQALEYSYQAFSDEIDEILKKLINMGKGIEMNMGGFKYGLGFCTSPSGCDPQIPGTGRRDYYGRGRRPQAGACSV